MPTHAHVAGLASGVASLLLVLCAPAARAQVWSCNGYEQTVYASSSQTEYEAHGNLACPTDTWPFDLGVVSGDVSHVTDGDSTTVHLQSEDPASGWSGALDMLGSFSLAFGEATLVSLDVDIQHVQGSAGGISLPPGCAYPIPNDVSAIERPGGLDLYFGEGGGTCELFLQPTMYMGSSGGGESIVTVTATSAPLPIVPSLAVEIIDRQGGEYFELYRPADVAVGPGGDVFVSNESVASAFRITPAGEITPTDAEGFMDSAAVAVDAAGAIYVARYTTDVVTKLTPGVSFEDIIDWTGDGAGAYLTRPADIALDTAGNVYVPGQWSNNVFEVTPGGAVTELVDTTGDGTHALVDPTGVGVDAAGNVYVAAGVSNNAFKITPAGVVTQILDGSGDGVGNVLAGAFDVVVSPAGHVYVSGSSSDNVFHVSPTGVVTQVLDASGNGSGHVCDRPLRMALDPEGNLYVACSDSHNVLQVSPAGAVEELMDERGDGAENPLRAPRGVAYGNGRLYVTGLDSHNAYRINLARRVPLPWMTGLAAAALILATGWRRLARGTSAV